MAKGAEEAFDTSNPVASIGPVPLTGYGVGRYVVRLEVGHGRGDEQRSGRSRSRNGEV